MSINEVVFAKQARQTITELLAQDYNQEYLRNRVGKLLQQVYYTSGKEEANKIVVDLNLTVLLKISIKE